jgi:hypothetical protein
MFRPFVLLLLGLTGAAIAPMAGQTDSLMKGLKRVGTLVQVSFPDRYFISSTGEDRAREILSERLTLELRKLGLVVDSSATDAVYCGVTVATRSPDRVSTAGSPALASFAAQSTEVALVERALVQRTGQSRSVPTWRTGTLGFFNLTETASTVARAAVYCAEQFGAAWRAANSPGRQA